MSARFRIIDTGLREGRANIAFDQAMIDLHRAGTIPDTFRFIHFPPTALIGRHQALSHEIDVEHCQSKGIGIARRLTGGGAIYFDEGQLGWALVFDRKTFAINSLEALAREICEAAASGLQRLGVNARYRPRNDIEVDGRKISGTGGFFDGDTLFYQGTVLVDMNAADMISALRVPAHKLGKRGIDSAAQRIVTLKELLGSKLPEMPEIQAALLEGFAEKLAIDPFAAEVTQAEEQAAAKIYAEEVGTDAFVAEIDDPETAGDVYTGRYTGTGGTITSYVRLEGSGAVRFREVLLTGDYFVTPPRVIYDLEAALRGTPVDDVATSVNNFFAQTDVDLLSVAPADFINAIETGLGDPAVSARASHAS